MSLKVIAIDFNKAPLEVRGRAALGAKEKLLRLVESLEEKVWLSTCNRVELYFVGGDAEEALIGRWMDLAGLSAADRHSFQILSDENALRHLFRVASSLESMVVGETQISGQVKKSYEEAVAQNWVGFHLHKIFQRAFRVSKKVRAQTEVGRLAVSVPSLGVKLSESVLGNLAEREVGILGLGEMGRLSAEHFASVQPQKIWLYNRTPEIAENLCQQLTSQGSQVRISLDAETLIDRVDVLVMAADADLISEDSLRKREERGEAFFVLDLTVPARVPRISLERGFIYGIDDLKSLAEQNQQLRKQELVKAELMIEEEVQSLLRQGEGTSVKDALRELSVKTAQITDEELRSLRQKLQHLKPEDWVEIEQMAKRLSTKVVQDPVVELKSLAKTSTEAEGLLHLFRSLFKI